MSCTTSTLKFLSFFFDFVCITFGALEVAANAYALHNYELSDVVLVPCILGIILGSLLFLIPIFGCCGSLRESVRITWVYAVILLVLMIGQIVVFFLLSVDFSKLSEETITIAWNQQLVEPGSMATYEVQYFCCGKNGPSDYADSGLNIPGSCYKNQNSTIPTDLYTDGCINKLNLDYLYAGRIELISDWTIVAVQGATIIISCMLAVSLKNEQRRRQY